MDRRGANDNYQDPMDPDFFAQLMAALDTPFKLYSQELEEEYKKQANLPLNVLRDKIAEHTDAALEIATSAINPAQDELVDIKLTSEQRDHLERLIHQHLIELTDTALGQHSTAVIDDDGKEFTTYSETVATEPEADRSNVIALDRGDK